MNYPSSGPFGPAAPIQTSPPLSKGGWYHYNNAESKSENTKRMVLYRTGMKIPGKSAYGYVFPAGIGQSSSVIDDQNTQFITTAAKVKKVSKSAPSILPLVPLQM